MPKKTRDVRVFSDRIQTLVAKVQEKYGEHALVTGGEVAQSHRQRIPFNIFGLDAAIGGGVPKGRVTLLIGEYSASKTTLAVKMSAQAQRFCRYCHTHFKYTVHKQKDQTTITPVKPCKCGKNRPNVVVYMDVEGTLDLTYCRALGFEPDLALLIQPDYAEQGIDVADAMVRSGEADVVVVDSIAALTPTTEVEESAERWQQGLGARLVNKFCRKLSSALNSLGAKTMMKPAIVFINQKREKIGVMYGDPTTIPYGKGQEFISALTLDLRLGKPIRMDDEGRELETKGEVVGRWVHWKVKKNKVSPGQGRSGEFKLYTITSPRFHLKTGQVNNDEQLLGSATMLGIVEAAGGGTYRYGKVSARGAAKFLHALTKAKLLRPLKAEVAQAILAQGVATEE